MPEATSLPEFGSYLAARKQNIELTVTYDTRGFDECDTLTVLSEFKRGVKTIGRVSSSLFGTSNEKGFLLAQRCTSEAHHREEAKSGATAMRQYCRIFNRIRAARRGCTCAKLQYVRV